MVSIELCIILRGVGRGVHHISTMPPPNEKAQSTAQIGVAQPTAFISNVPLPPRLELHGNLAQNWSNRDKPELHRKR